MDQRARLPRFRHSGFGPSRAGFSLVEALIAVTLTTTAGAALLNIVFVSQRAVEENLRASVAAGMAEQLMQEIVQSPIPSGPSTMAPAGSPRSSFDDIDDYSGYVACPPLSRNGQTLGAEGSSADEVATARVAGMNAQLTWLATFQQEAIVEKVVPSGTTWVATTAAGDYRRVTVRIRDVRDSNNPVVRAELVRIFAYVAPAP